MALWLRLPIFAVVGCCLTVLAVAAFIHLQQHSLVYHPAPMRSGLHARVAAEWRRD